MAEGDDAAGQPQHALGHGVLGGAQRVDGQGLKQADLYPGTRQSDQVEHAPGGLGQPRHPGHDGVADCGGRLGRAGREHLGDEERVAAGHPEQLCGVDGRHVRVGVRADGMPGQRRDGRLRQRRQVQSPDARGGSRVTDDLAQRVACRGVLTAVGHQDQGVERVRATSQIAQQVQCRLIGPVHVLEDEQMRRERPRLAQRGRRRVKTSCRAASAGQTPGGNRGSISASAPSGAGVPEPSLVPSAADASAPASAITRVTKDVLPTPASPAMKTRRP